MVGLHFGKEAGNPYYVQVGDAVMIDPTFFDYKTKKAFRGKQMQYNPNLY